MNCQAPKRNWSDLLIHLICSSKWILTKKSFSDILVHSFPPCTVQVLIAFQYLIWCQPAQYKITIDNRTQYELIADWHQDMEDQVQNGCFERNTNFEEYKSQDKDSVSDLSSKCSNTRYLWLFSLSTILQLRFWCKYQ